MRKIFFYNAINEAMFLAMHNDKKVIAYGLGISDPKSIFGTTLGLQEEFGEDRVFDMPIAENAMTGMAVGAAISGYKPVLVHQRLDFALLSLDQIVNSAAKWFYMFGGKTPVPIVIRMIVGRGWGQGPTHSQALHAWFSHIPGLKVVLPSNPSDAKGLLLESINDPNPVIFIEHRWLHNTLGFVSDDYFRVALGSANIKIRGKDITILSFSLMTIEAIIATKFLKKYGISCEVVDLRTIRPIDWKTIIRSIKKTTKLLVLDISQKTGSISGELVSRICEDHFSCLSHPPVRIASPDHAVPTSFSLTKNFYPNAKNIINEISKIFSIEIKNKYQDNKYPHDIPGDWFKGPF